MTTQLWPEPTVKGLTGGRCLLQVTVWAGVFPIVVSWWAAVALTAFIVAQFLVTSYCRNRKHLKPLWFNSVSNNILWFTFVKVGHPALLPLRCHYYFVMMGSV